MRPAQRKALIRYLVIGLGSAVIVGISLVLLGFGIRLDALCLIGVVIAVSCWFFARVFDPADDSTGGEPISPPRQRSIGLDRRIRALESQLSGARTGRAMTVSALHDTICQLAAKRSDDNEPGSSDTALRRYIDAPPRPLSRAQLRTILRELSSR